MVQNPDFLVVILLPFNEQEPETDQTLVPFETVSAKDEVAYPVDGNIDGTFQVKIGALAALTGFINTDEDKSPRGTTHKITCLNIILPQSSAALLMWVLFFRKALLPFQFSTCQRLRQDISLQMPATHRSGLHRSVLRYKGLYLRPLYLPGSHLPGSHRRELCQTGMRL